MNDDFDDVSAEEFYEYQPDDFEQYNQNEADDYRHDYDDSPSLPSSMLNWQLNLIDKEIYHG